MKAFAQTVTALQGDTLDAIAHRVYGDASGAMLAQLVELNDKFNPSALLPLGAEIQIPNRQIKQSQATIKLWD